MSLYQELCTPSKLYITLAIIYAIAAYFSMNEFSNFMQINQSKMHPYLNSLNFSATKREFTLANVIFILFWTWLLNFICSAGYTKVSWFLVLFPYLCLFIFIVFAIWTLFKTQVMTLAA